MNAVFNNHDPRFYIGGILNGDKVVLSRAITLIESHNETHRQIAAKIIDGVIGHSGKSFRLGITGVPGVGKSTFIEIFGKEVLRNGYRLAVLAIDPSSTKSKGSILGDKTRMEDLSTRDNVYIRPSPSNGTLGGVTRATYETIVLCEAAGFDFIVVETVGVGQSEVAASRITDFFLLLMLAGAGDELQGIKRGIMEMADALVITKADGENISKAKAARAEYAHAMHLLQAPKSGWVPRALVSSAINNSGVEEVYRMVEEYKTFTSSNGYFFQNRNSQQYELLLSALDETLKQKFYSDPAVKAKMLGLKDQNPATKIHPFSLAKNMVDDFFAK